jgi:hypothetical protein
MVVVRWPGKTRGAMVFACSFWLLFEQAKSDSPKAQ